MRTRLGVSYLLLTVALFTGCISHTRHLAKDQVLLKAQTISRSALLDKLKSRSLEIKTLTVTKSSIKPSHILSGEAIKDFTGAGATIVVDRPSHIYMEIEKIGATVADMVSDGKLYKVSIPHIGSGRYGVGDAAEPPETVEFPFNLRPSHILDALFVDGEQYMGASGITTVVKEATNPQSDGVHSYYLVDFAMGEVPLEELWVDRTGTAMQVTRKIQYKEDGRIEADIQYSDYGMFDSISFPKQIVIRRPIENYSLELQLQKLELNKSVDSEAFDLPRPPGAEDFDVNTGKVITRP
jgi:hypothetical protein